MTKRLASLLAIAGAATAFLVGAGSAGAASYSAYCPGDSGYLQTLINGAGSGDTITIYGTCYGNYTVSGKSNLTLQGGSAGATLNGKSQGTTLTIENSSVTIRNLSVVNGNAGVGGGMDVYVSDLTMANVTVRGNTADEGGGIALVRSFAELTGTTLTRNTALYEGGGIQVAESELRMTASTVSMNRLTGSGLVYGGGGIWMERSNVFLTSTRVTGNTSADYGGGIADYGACPSFFSAPIGQQSICFPRAGTAGGRSVAGRGLFDGVATGLTLVSSSVDHNIAGDDGGGIYNASESGDSPVTLDGSVVSFNVAQSGDGGGIYNYGENGNTATLLATGSTFQGNQARKGDGGAVFNGAIVMLGSGTAVATFGQSSAATGSTIANSNQARRGGAFANVEGDGVASLTLQPGATVKGNKASVTGGGVWNNCGSFSSLASILLNSPNNVVNTCLF